MQISGSSEGIKKKGVKTASDIGASGKDIELGEKEEPEKGVTEALLVREKIRCRRKFLSEMRKGQNQNRTLVKKEMLQTVLLMWVVNLAKRERQKKSLKLMLLLKKKMFW